MRRILVTGSMESSNSDKFINNETLLLGMDRDKNGKFVQTRKEWALDNFDDGYVDNRGRFRIWLPNHPRAYKEGYMLRSIVAFELYHGIAIPPDMDVHHVDGNRLNDSKENLALLPHREHGEVSNYKKKLDAQVTRICEYCGKEFPIKKGRLNDKTKAYRFCSLKCYHEHPRSESHIKNISDGLKKAYLEGRR